MTKSISMMEKFSKENMKKESHEAKHKNRQKIPFEQVEANMYATNNF